MQNHVIRGTPIVGGEVNSAALVQHLPRPLGETTEPDECGVPSGKGTGFTGHPVPIPGWKRATDIAFCLAALPVFGFIALMVTVLMMIASPGPLFFRQERIGYRNRRFMCYKFRTMLVGADGKTHQLHCENLIHSNAPMVKMDTCRDPRIIPGGWFLRASGMDELPQIINVFRGDMSLVGPRPCVPYEYEKFNTWQRERFNSMPGLTGLWQVSGKNRTTYEQMLRLDVRYARNMSWLLDLKIILLTLPALLGQIVNTRRARRILAQYAPAASPGMAATSTDGSRLMKHVRSVA